MNAAICGMLVGGFGTLAFLFVWFCVLFFLTVDSWDAGTALVVWIGGGVAFLPLLAFVVAPWVC